MISNNHYQAPVRRFILDLFDVKLSPETLIRLRHLDLASGAKQTSTGEEGNERHDEDRLQKEYIVDGSEDESHPESRRRSASSPGPEPLSRQVRARGLTIGSMTPNSGPREKVNGFGVE